jgi:hypothetical protein
MTDTKYFKYAFVKGEKLKRTIKMKMSSSSQDATVDEIIEHKNFRKFKQNTRSVKIPVLGRHIR